MNKSATVILDGEEATLEFVDLSDSDGEVGKIFDSLQSCSTRPRLDGPPVWI